MADLYFSDFIEEDDFQDWKIGASAGGNFTSFIETSWLAPDDIMFWAQTPYVYTFMRNNGFENDGVTRVDGLTFKVKWDWKE